jgi:2-amino-4-hydroxy-6-hydroxymethyldihydropteridine diphosphokinase
MVVGADTDMTAPALLAAIKALEPALGRVASFHMGPRTIDIDLLLHGSQRIATERLTVPHPGMLQRAFVLQPLAELAADLRHPVTGETIAVHAARVGSAGVQRLGDAADILPQQGQQ